MVKKQVVHATKKVRPDLNGPFVALAVLCERVLTERDNVQTLVRVFDKVTVASEIPRGKDPSARIKLTVVVGFRSGSFEGNLKLRFVLKAPSGKTLDGASPGELTINFEGGQQGPTAILEAALDVREQGVHWIDVYLSKTRMTRIPFLVEYSPPPQFESDSEK